MLVAFPVNIKSQEMKFGQITITPFIADNVSLDGIGKKIII